MIHNIRQLKFDLRIVCKIPSTSEYIVITVLRQLIVTVDLTKIGFFRCIKLEIVCYG